MRWLNAQTSTTTVDDHRSPDESAKPSNHRSASSPPVRLHPIPSRPGAACLSINPFVYQQAPISPPVHLLPHPSPARRPYVKVDERRTDGQVGEILDRRTGGVTSGWNRIMYKGKQAAAGVGGWVGQLTNG